MSELERYYEILAKHGMVPFQREPWINPETGRREPRVLGERPDWRWRVSPDESFRLATLTPKALSAHMAGAAPYIGGWPVVVDDDLPPGSVIFEPRSA